MSETCGRCGASTSVNKIKSIGSYKHTPIVFYANICAKCLVDLSSLDLNIDNYFNFDHTFEIIEQDISNYSEEDIEIIARHVAHHKMEYEYQQKLFLGFKDTLYDLLEKIEE